MILSGRSDPLGWGLHISQQIKLHATSSQKTGSVPQVWQRDCVLCINKSSLLAAMWRSLRRTDHSFTKVLLNVVCPVRVIAKPRKGRPWPIMGSKPNKEENLTAVC